MKKIALGVCLATSLITALPALADRVEHHRYDRNDNGRHYYSRHHTEHQWRSGRWYHGTYSGRIGWWWIVDGLYYPYAQRSNVYPTYQETVVVEQPAPPPTIIVQQPVPQPVQVQPQPQYPQYPPPQTQQYPTGVTPQPNSNSNLWYYCDASRMYYPYINNCASGWRAVPATPPTGVIR